MQRDFQVECRSYDQILRGSWQAYKLDNSMQLGDEQPVATPDESIKLWLPTGTQMNWASGTRPLRSNCLQFFWPQRWYVLSAFYNEGVLIHTYATIIQPATITFGHLTYTDLDLSILVKPDMSYEVLTQAEFEQLAEMLHYSEDTRTGALMAQRTITSFYSTQCWYIRWRSTASEAPKLSHGAL